jgi:hypothetical protein
MTWMELLHRLRCVVTGGGGRETSEPGRLYRRPHFLYVYMDCQPSGSRYVAELLDTGAVLLWEFSLPNLWRLILHSDGWVRRVRDHPSVFRGGWLHGARGVAPAKPSGNAVGGQVCAGVLGVEA